MFSGYRSILDAMKTFAGGESAKEGGWIDIEV